MTILTFVWPIPFNLDFWHFLSNYIVCPFGRVESSANKLMWNKFLLWMRLSFLTSILVDVWQHNIYLLCYQFRPYILGEKHLLSISPDFSLISTYCSTCLGIWLTAGGLNNGRNMWALTVGICTMLESTICTQDPLTTLDSFQVMNFECCASSLFCHILIDRCCEKLVYFASSKTIFVVILETLKNEYLIQSCVGNFILSGLQSTWVLMFQSLKGWFNFTPKLDS